MLAGLSPACNSNRPHANAAVPPFSSQPPPADISMAVPISNSVTFLWTLVTSVLLGEAALRPADVAGSLVVVAGVAICVHSKLDP